MHCLCGAWDLGDVSDSGHRFSLLSQLIEAVKDLDGIVYEDCPGLRGRALKWFNGYEAAARISAYRMSIPFTPVNTSTWKKYMLKNSRASKQESQDQALTKYGLDPQAPHDSADALHLLDWGLTSARLAKAYEEIKRAG
jgi:hypothetical protein